MENWRTDVVIVGGGTAGVTAAIAAAEEGADVVLVERDSGLGGVGVRAGVHFYYLGTAGGIQDSLDETAEQLNERMGTDFKGFLPESKGLVIGKRFAELGIRVVYEAVVADVLMDGARICGVIAESERETIRIESTVTIDATGDGDIAYLAGAAYTLGRDWDGALHNYSLVPRYVDPASKQLRCKNFDVGWVDATDIGDVSRAYRTGRRHAWRGDEDPIRTPYTVVGPQLGVREGRLIEGDYRLSQHDLLLDRRFNDVVMRCFAHHENHAFDYANESEWSQIWVAVLGMWRFGFGGDVPYRCLLPRGIDGLLIGCRAFSQDHDNAVMLRMQRDMHKIGEAAGTAAALSVKEAVLPREIDISRLQSRLISRGVLESADLTRESRPWLAFKGETPEQRARPLREGVRAADVDELISRLGGDEESAALWWLWTYGDVCAPVLLEALMRTEGRQRRGVGFALGLLRHPAAAPVLIETIRRRDEDRPNKQPRTEERWIAAFILLKRMGDASVAADATRLLRSERRSATLLFLLHYLISVADRLEESAAEEVAEAVQAMLGSEKLGDDFVLHGAGPLLPASEDTRSMRWGLELAAGYLLRMTGGEGEPILERYRQDRRAYARVAADRLSRRLTQPKSGANVGETMRRNWDSELPSMGKFDAVVIGGGITGVSAARMLAAEGRRVALLEPTGVLGREITRAFNLFVGIPKFAGLLPTLREYYDHLCRCKGWFHEQLDAAAAAVALDEWLAGYSVTVHFHVWPSRLLMEGTKVVGLEVSARTGRMRLEASTVIDASRCGKIARGMFPVRSADTAISCVNLLYSGIEGSCPAETAVESARIGELRVLCRRSLRPNEWRVTLVGSGRRSRSEWQLVLEEALLLLRERIPALRSGVLTHLADDADGEPELRVAVGSREAGIAGCMIDPFSTKDGAEAEFTFPVSRGMLYDRAVADGLYVAGPWLAGYPHDPMREETAIVNAFRLGELAGEAALRMSTDNS